ncbi:MAG: hypothetical protein CVV41_03205 [Candidatus Riflebacteria bacterium HGW-Riflebacteria-1]|jgi:uncharacterized protein (DUF362 family)/Pyruvate/2-oxoacid:ferredoxin oxidoreductase delta subunit|nr:MAG: hypothetical protein CVV41_03205 [Candidatus Riflebacteria bacterium HGW-Riflebacteria-1]
MTKAVLSLQKCNSYDQALVDDTIKRLLAPLGGIEAFVRPGQRVLIKPNMLSCKDPDKAATTHPAVIEAVARVCRDAGARVFIGDSPPSIFGRTEEFWNKTGFATAAANSGAELICFENDDKTPVNFVSNRKQLTVYVTRHYFDADLVINLPKMKTHNLTRITGAMKNLFGLLPGLAKAQWHKTFPRPVEFSNFITDLAKQLPCGLTIMDAIEGMDGQGPAGGRVVTPGALLAATSPVTVDLGFCGIVGLDPDTIPMLKRCREIGWGATSLDQIELTGEPIANLKMLDYRVPRLAPISFIPEFLLNFARRFFWAGPALLPDLCIKCGRCKKICPAAAIEIADTGAEFNRDRCISCFCCMEVCPVDAIEMKTSLLLGLIFKMRGLKGKLRNRKN